MSLFKTLGEYTEPVPEPKSVAMTTEAKDGKNSLGKLASAVSQVIGPLKMGNTVHYASMGEWSAHDILFHVLDYTGPADVMIATWSISENATRQLIGAVTDGRITSIAAILDWRVKMRRPEVYELAKFNIADIRLTTCHAKVTTVRNSDWDVTIIGSANYTNNPRIEAGIIACDTAVTKFHDGWMRGELANSDPFDTKKTSKRG